MIGMYRRRKRCCAWMAPVILCSQLLQAQSVAKVAVVSLRDYGWEVPGPIYPREVDAAGGRSIVIDHEGGVLVGFVVRARSGLVTREQPALAFRILRFMPDGKRDLSLCQPMDGTPTVCICPTPTESSQGPTTAFNSWSQARIQPTSRKVLGRLLRRVLCVVEYGNHRVGARCCFPRERPIRLWRLSIRYGH